MAEGGALEIPTLPIDHAAETLLAANPVLGAVIVLEAAAIIVLAIYIARLSKAKDEELAAAKAEHIADVKVMIPALHDLRETVLAAIQQIPRRRT